MALSTTNYPNNAAPILVQTSVQAGDSITGPGAVGVPTPFATQLQLSSSYFNAVGTVVKVRLWGTISTAATPSNIVFSLLLDGGTVIGNSAQITPAANQGNIGWHAEYDLIVTATGASGQVECQGRLHLPTNQDLPATQNTTTVAIDLSGPSHTLALEVTYQSSHNGDAITQRVIYANAI